MAKLTYKVSYYIFYVLIALILVVLGLFFCVGYNNPVGEYNAPQHTETLLFVGLFAAVLAVSYAMGSDAPIVMGDGKEFTDASWLKLADMTLYAIYFLVAVAGISTIVNLSGIFKR